MDKQEIVVVWLKRDLRFTDHEPLYSAQQQHLPVMLVYCFEPSVMNYADSAIRHWRFVYQSLQDMQAKLVDLNAQVYIFHDDAASVFNKIAQHYHIHTIFSHEEIGNKITFDRDLVIKTFCIENNIVWRESQHNGVVRRLQSKNNRAQLWKEK